VILQHSWFLTILQGRIVGWKIPVSVAWAG
jgi:hypothetical protein